MMRKSWTATKINRVFISFKSCDADIKGSFTFDFDFEEAKPAALFFDDYILVTDFQWYSQHS